MGKLIARLFLVERRKIFSCIRTLEELEIGLVVPHSQQAD